MSEDTPAIVDNRRNKRLYEELDDWKPDEDRNPNRLSNLRWALGHEPDGEGSIKEDGWVNVKLEVTEHADPGPNQRKGLKLGVELKLPCGKCGQPMHVAGSKAVKEVLEEGGYRFREDMEFPKEKLLIAMCQMGHTLQLRGDQLERLRRN